MKVAEVLARDTGEVSDWRAPFHHWVVRTRVRLLDAGYGQPIDLLMVAAEGGRLDVYEAKYLTTSGFGPDVHIRLVTSLESRDVEVLRRDIIQYVNKI